MASFTILEDFHPHVNEEFLKKAEVLTPSLQESYLEPKDFSERTMHKDDEVILDFGDHHVGYVTLDLAQAGSHQDAPAYIYLRFAERMEELEVSMAEYNGWISKGWIQEEYIHVDVLPAKLTLPRRYAFRYMQVKVIDVSQKFSLVLKGVQMKQVSAVSMKDYSELPMEDELLKRIDSVAARTLCNCMQLVFEDGPKRDRRMWLGDFRLEARANYQLFKNYDLVKRCLYLFGGLTFNEGKLAACLFLEPKPEPDDTYLFDYALLYGSVLLDYYEETGDKETLEELYPIAIRQIEIGLDYLTEDGIIPDHSGEFWCFVDWGDGLNVQAASLAILIYAMRYGIRLADCMQDKERIAWLESRIGELKESAVAHFWDEEKQLFVSGQEKQVSWATQVWMILARVFPQEESRKLILHTIEVNPSVRMVSPYMYHHYIDALIRCGEKERALEEIKRYWGGMIQDGADTFWEIYDPDDKKESPYGSVAANSFCHAWSCTPSYFLRKFYLTDK